VLVVEDDALVVVTTGSAPTWTVDLRKAIAVFKSHIPTATGKSRLVKVRLGEGHELGR